MRFWDSSAVVPLVMAQPASRLADRWRAEDAQVALWTLTPVEVVSAVQRLVREGAVGSEQAELAESRAAEITEASHVVVDVESVKEQAKRLLRLHPLRAADALQLGAALEWAAGSPASRTLHTLDARLAAAARREGFRVVAA